MLGVHTWARCCLRSDTLYLTHDMTALNTCSSDLTFSSSLEIISTSWPTGSNRNSSLSITCNPFITSINGMCTLFDITITKSKAQFSHCIWSFQFNFYKFQIKCKYIVQQFSVSCLIQFFKGVQLDILRYLLYTTEKLNYNQSDEQAIKTVFAAKCYVAMTQKWYYPPILQNFMYDDNYMVKIIVVLIEH